MDIEPFGCWNHYCLNLTSTSGRFSCYSDFSEKCRWLNKSTCKGMAYLVIYANWLIPFFFQEAISFCKILLPWFLFFMYQKRKNEVGHSFILWTEIPYTIWTVLMLWGFNWTDNFFFWKEHWHGCGFAIWLWNNLNSDVWTTWSAMQDGALNMLELETSLSFQQKSDPVM